MRDLTIICNSQTAHGIHTWQYITESCRYCSYYSTLQAFQLSVLQCHWQKFQLTILISLATQRSLKYCGCKLFPLIYPGTIGNCFWDQEAQKILFWNTVTNIISFPLFLAMKKLHVKCQTSILHWQYSHLFLTISYSKVGIILVNDHYSTL